MFETLNFFDWGVCSVMMTNLTGGKDCGDYCGDNIVIAVNSKPYKHLFKHKANGEKTAEYSLMQSFKV